MSEYGKLNGVPIDPGEGWEIVPEAEARTFKGESRNGYGVLFNSRSLIGWFTAETPFWDGSIFAFRRPIVAGKEMLQAGQGETGAVCDFCGKPAVCRGTSEGDPTEQNACNECCGHGNEDGHCCRIQPVAVDEKANLSASLISASAELARLRTLTAAQSKALEKAEEALQPFMSDTQREALRKETLTLIQQASEVGK